MKNIQFVAGCAHAPFHNKPMWNGVFQLLKDLGKSLNGVNLIGDIADLNSLSFHDRGQYPIRVGTEDIDLLWEYRQVNKFFDQIDSAIGRRKIEKRFVYGNHEDRYLRHLRLPDSKRIIADRPENALRLRERGYDVKTNWTEDYFILGDHLEIFHGYLLGVNPAKRQLDKLKKSCMFAHSHRVGMHYDSNMASFNIGWGGDKNSPAFSYAGRLIKKDWINGFALVTIDDNGFYHPQVITVYNNRFYYNGKKYGI